MSGLLHVFALNRPLDVRHTDLTRQKGEATALPDLAAWLGVAEIDTDRIELFPVSDLEHLPLADYVATGHEALAGPLADAASRLNALSGAVLLVPDIALTEPPQPGPEATLIASLPVAQPDHVASLPKAPIPSPEPSAPETRAAPSAPGRRTATLLVLAGLLFAALFIWVVG